MAERPRTRVYRDFREFYPDYLAEHRNRTSRRLHFFGTLLVITTLVVSIATQMWLLLLAVPFFGYGLAWLGHFVFEKNRPATFKHPLYSLMGDIVMFWQILSGKLKF